MIKFNNLSISLLFLLFLIFFGYWFFFYSVEVNISGRFEGDKFIVNNTKGLPERFYKEVEYIILCDEKSHCNFINVTLIESSTYDYIFVLDKYPLDNYKYISAKTRVFNLF
ncbi:hypothetical protein [Litoribacter populi]|uniref:hypothetical protein n=1 Tax=Litoribacter populi TaxID=2598460 RepID=UPI001180C162|nr:hypothetical protein [Litoribacter populi]